MSTSDVVESPLGVLVADVCELASDVEFTKPVKLRDMPNADVVLEATPAVKALLLNPVTTLDDEVEAGVAFVVDAAAESRPKRSFTTLFTSSCRVFAGSVEASLDATLLVSSATWFDPNGPVACT